MLAKKTFIKIGKIPHNKSSERMFMGFSIGCIFISTGLFFTSVFNKSKSHSEYRLSNEVLHKLPLNIQRNIIKH
jgi:hypothetical protein